MASSMKRWSFRLRASASPAGRSRLPTWSAWKGGFIPLWYLAARAQVGDALGCRAQRAVGPVVARQLAVLLQGGGEQLAFARFRHGGGFPAEMRGGDHPVLLQGEVLPQPVAQRRVPRRVPDVDAFFGVP